MAKVQLDGFALNAEVHAGLVAKDTVFIHGNLASNTWWEPTLSVLRKKTKPPYQGRLVCVEWRGCGQSDPPQTIDDLRPHKLGADCVQLLQRLEIQKTHVVGHSTGGLIALEAMLQAPQLFDRAVVLDTVGATGVQFDPPVIEAFQQMSRDRKFCAAVMSGTIHGVDTASPLFQRIVDDAFGVAKLIWSGIPTVLRDVDLRADLKKITQAVLVLHGELDNVLPNEGSKTLAQELLFNAHYVELKGQGHSCNVENPELFVSLMTDFLFSSSSSSLSAESTMRG